MPPEHGTPYQTKILFVSVIRSWNTFDISDRFEAWNRHVGDIDVKLRTDRVAIVEHTFWNDFIRYETSPSQKQIARIDRNVWMTCDSIPFYPRIARFYPRIVRWKENIRRDNVTIVKRASYYFVHESSSCMRGTHVWEVVSIIVRKGWILFRYFWSYEIWRELEGILSFFSFKKINEFYRDMRYLLWFGEKEFLHGDFKALDGEKRQREREKDYSR